MCILGRRDECNNSKCSRLRVLRGSKSSFLVLHDTPVLVQALESPKPHGDGLGFNC